MLTVDAALDIARRFGPIWPHTPQKTGYRGTNGSRDASRDESTIRQWCSLYPDAVFALLTGEVSGVVALDVDIKNGRNGRDSLELLGITSIRRRPRRTHHRAAIIACSGIRAFRFVAIKTYWGRG